MKDKLYQMVSDLFGPPKPGDALSVKIQRFREEIKKAAEREDALLGKFLVLLESFRQTVPDEKQRYQVAVQALSTTSRMSKDEIVQAIGAQAAEMATVEKSLLSAIPNRHDELAGWDAKAKALRAEITRLQARVAQLETDEKAILNYIPARQRELEFIEKSMKESFAAVAADIANVKSRILTGESVPVVQATPAAPPQAAPQSVPQPVPEPVSETGPETTGPEPPVQIDPATQKKCPMCGGIMNLHAAGMWMCYTCGNEEAGPAGAPAGSGETRENTAPAASDSIPDMPAMEYEPSEQPTPTRSRASAKPKLSKSCPACREKLYWYPDEKFWRCRSCGYERGE